MALSLIALRSVIELVVNSLLSLTGSPVCPWFDFQHVSVCLRNILNLLTKLKVHQKKSPVPGRFSPVFIISFKITLLMILTN